MKSFILVACFFIGHQFAGAQHENHSTGAARVPSKKDTISTNQSQNKLTKGRAVKKQISKESNRNENSQGDTIPNRATVHAEHDNTNDDSLPVLMTHAYSRNLPMSRNGSGTAWLPDASPMFMYMRGNERSNLMVHGNVFFRYNRQDILKNGSRGGKKFDVPNWFMGMYNRLVGSRGLLNATAMISFDPLTVGKSGYPLLFQSGETYKGSRLVDRQHPHDLISGLSVAYTHMINRDVDVTAYLGYPGEPALGPVAFMHRISALNNPDAPLGHHWQDATHIVFGVGTLGIRLKQFKLEGSIFTGSEPDEDRYDFDKPKFNSYSYRVSFNPNQDWAIQFSQGFLTEPEALEPGVDVTRTTASLARSKSMTTMNWSQTAVWGMNSKQGHEKKEHSFLYENNLQSQNQALYMRYEFIKKSAKELNLETAFGDVLFSINAFTLGYNRNISPAAPVEILAGLQSTVNFPDKDLIPLYGRVPLSLEVYLQIRPRRHSHD